MAQAGLGRSAEEKLTELEMQVEVLTRLSQVLARSSTSCCSNSCSFFPEEVAALKRQTLASVNGGLYGTRR